MNRQTASLANNYGIRCRSQTGSGLTGRDSGMGRRTRGFGRRVLAGLPNENAPQTHARPCTNQGVIRCNN